MGANQEKTQVAVVGAFQDGKSTLINCLLDDKYAPTGNGLRTTACCTYFHYGEAEVARIVHADKTSEVLDRREEFFSKDFHCSGRDHVEISCWKPLLQKLVLIDTPGFDASAEDDSAAERAIEQADIIIFVQSVRQMSEKVFPILESVKGKGKRLLCLVNCKNTSNWHPADMKNAELCQIIETQLAGWGLDDLLIRIQEHLVWPCNPIFAWYALGHLQRDLDASDASIKQSAEDQLEQIHYFCRKRKIPDKVSKEILLKASGILEVRREIEDISMHSLYRLCAAPAQEIKALTAVWSSRIRNMLSQEKKDLKKI